MSRDPRLREQLTIVEDGLRQLAGDLGGVGLLDDGERAPELADLERLAALELESVRQTLVDVTAKLRMLRPRHLARQLGALGALSEELRLCLTGAAPPGWISVGFPPAQVVADLRWGLPFADGAATRVYFALALEHLFYRGEALAVLRAVRRVLAPGGVLRVVVPDLEAYLRAYTAGDRAFFDGHLELWDWAQHARTPLDLLLMMAGAGMARGPGDFFGHKTGYDFETLRRLLAEAGFATVTRSAYQASAHADLRIDHLSHDAGYAAGETSYNLFVDAS